MEFDLAVEAMGYILLLVIAEVWLWLGQVVYERSFGTKNLPGWKKVVFNLGCLAVWPAVAVLKKK